MRRNEEKPMTKTTSNILIGVLIGGLCLGMMNGCDKKVKEDAKKPLPVLKMKNKSQLER